MCPLDHELTFVSHCFPLATGHRGVLLSDRFLVLLGFGCQCFYSLALSPCSLHSYSSLVWCPFCIRRKTFNSNQLDLHPFCSFFPLPGLLLDTIANFRAPIWNRLVDQKQSAYYSSCDCCYSTKLDQCQVKNEVANHLLPWPLLHQ